MINHFGQIILVPRPASRSSFFQSSADVEVTTAANPSSPSVADVSGDDVEQAHNTISPDGVPVDVMHLVALTARDEVQDTDTDFEAGGSVAGEVHALDEQRGSLDSDGEQSCVFACS